MAIFLAASLLALIAPSIETLIAARFVQGIGASAGVAISRAIVRDMYQGDESSRIMNLMGIILAVAPALAPTLGGLLVTHAGVAVGFPRNDLVWCGGDRRDVVGVTRNRDPRSSPPEPAQSGEFLCHAGDEPAFHDHVVDHRRGQSARFMRKRRSCLHPDARTRTEPDRIRNGYADAIGQFSCRVVGVAPTYETLQRLSPGDSGAGIHRLGSG